VNEKNNDYAYLIQKHKDFFQRIDDDILHGFIAAGKELLHIREATEQRDIQLLMSTLESKWNMIICFAPIRLLRLQYERIESLIVDELKQANEELNEELHALERQDDSTDLLQRHHARFQSNEFQPTIEIHIRDLKTVANDIRNKERAQTLIKPENERIDQRTKQLNDYWTEMQTKIDRVRHKLQTVPKKWREFENKSVIALT
jgi:nesprin-1